MRYILHIIILYSLVIHACSTNKAQAPLATKHITPSPIAPTKTKASANVQRVAVLSIKNKCKSEISHDEVNYVTDQIRLIMNHLPRKKFFVMTQDNLEVMLDPNEMSLEDCTGSCEVETGRLLQAHWVLTGEVISLNDIFNMTLKVYHTQSAQLIKGISFQAKSMHTLIRALYQNVPFLLMNSFYVKQEYIKTLKLRIKNVL